MLWLLVWLREGGLDDDGVVVSGCVLWLITVLPSYVHLFIIFIILLSYTRPLWNQVLRVALRGFLECYNTSISYKNVVWEGKRTVRTYIQ